MRYIQIVLLVLVAICCNTCGYLPLLDRPIIGDFERRQYVFDKEDHSLIETDSANIVINAETLIPKRYRSRKLKIFYASVRFDIKKYLFNESLIIPLKPTMITSFDGVNIVTGDAKLMQMEYVPKLVIRKQRWYLVQSTLSTDSLFFTFDYSQVKEFDYNNQVLKIDLGNLKLPNGKVIKSKEIICRFQKTS